MLKGHRIRLAGVLWGFLALGFIVPAANAGPGLDVPGPDAAVTQEGALDDGDITTALDLELLLDEGVSSHLIDIETKEGIVTLSGSVDNILAKERAERIAENIKGVRSVVNLIEVEPVIRNDNELRNDIERALLVDPATDSYEIDATVDGGVVMLTGEVESWAEKELAEHVAKGVKGVVGVDNRIVINYRKKRADTEIQAEVKRRLEVNPLIDAAWIDVEVKDNKVTLTGTAGSARERTRAFSSAWVYGVDEVDISGLDVKVWARDEHKRQLAVLKSDQEIHEAVKDSFLYDPRVFSFEIDVDVDNGSVTLEGDVDNLKAKKAAAQDARNTPGVWNVDNRILVRPLTELSDEKIAQNLKDALFWNPIVERFDLTVIVRNKKAYLYGRVDDVFEKMAAEDVASRTNGIADVESNIQVDQVWVWKSDQMIQEDIEDQLDWNVFVDERAIDVSVDNGVATLDGEVDSLMELDAAIKEAFDGGARRVVNELAIDDSPDGYPGIYYHYGWPYWPYWYDSPAPRPE